MAWRDNMQKISCFLLAVVGMGMVIISGCSFTGQGYQSSYESVSALKAVQGKTHPINIANFTASSSARGTIMCRLAGPVQTANDSPYYQFLHDAMVADLKKANLYQENAETTLHANLDDIALSTMLGDGHWQIKMTFNDGKHSSYTITDRYNFSVNYIGDIACGEAATALTPAIQQFLLKVYRSKEFKKTLRE